MIVYYKNDDYGYEHWLRDTQTGYVFNDSSGPNLRDKILHKSDCRLLRNPGGSNKTSVRKVCSANLYELAGWIAQSRGPEGEGYSPCPCCEPFASETEEECEGRNIPVAIWI
jgi:hypothetical protein